MVELKESEIKLKIEKWYKNGRKLQINAQLECYLVIKSELPLYVLIILTDIYEGDEYLKKKSIDRAIEILKIKNLIEKKDDQWSLSKKGAKLLVIKLFQFLWNRPPEWRLSDLLPEDFSAY